MERPDAESLKSVLVANTGMEKEVRRVECTGRYDDFFRSFELDRPC